MMHTVSKLWIKLIGSPDEFTMENRAFNAIGVITCILMTILLGINLFLALFRIAVLLGAGLPIAFLLLYFSRVKKRVGLAIAIYALFSYVMVIANFFLNSGIEGPGLFFFFLTFMLLVAISPRWQHIFYLTLHIVLGLGLIALEYYRPQVITSSYLDQNDFFIDVAVSYVICLLFIFFVIHYLRQSYERAKRKAEAQTAKVERQKDALEQGNAEKDQLFSIISHDLRSPLNTIQTFLEVMASSDITEAEQQAIRKKLLTLTKHTSNMLTNLLTWAQTRMEGYEWQKESVEVKTTVEETVALQQMLARQKDITVASNIDESLKVWANRDMLQLIVRNLVHNAIKFSPKGGRVEVEASSNHVATIRVRDNGVGMSEAVKDTILSEEVRSTEGTQQEKGAGIGLKLCRDFVQILGGELWVESEEGQGSEFAFTLPLVNGQGELTKTT